MIVMKVTILYLFFRKFHPPFDVGSVHPGELSILEGVGVDSMLITIHHSDIHSILNRILTILRVSGVLHHIPRKRLQKSDHLGIMNPVVLIGSHMNLGVGIAFREVVDGPESMPRFINGEVSSFFKDFQNFLSVHFYLISHYKDNDFF